MRDRLLDIYRRLLAHYGRQHWWPGDGPFETMVGAVLTQAAAWTNVEKAIANLKSAGVLSPKALRAMPAEKLASLLYPVGYYNSKARKLKAIAEYAGERFDDDLDAMSRVDARILRTELLDVYGIGEETADDILVYAAGKPAFVIDAYTRRICARLGLSTDRASYGDLQSVFVDHLPPDVQLFNEYHALLDRHGKETCRKRPLCRECVLLGICPTGQTNAAPTPNPP